MSREQVLNRCVWALQEGVKVALSPSFSSSSIQVPKILNTLYTYMQQSTHRPFLLRAVLLLAHFHQEPTISSLLRKGLPMDRYRHYPLSPTVVSDPAARLYWGGPVERQVFFFCLNSLECCKTVCLCLCRQWGIVSPIVGEEV